MWESLRVVILLTYHLIMCVDKSVVDIPQMFSSQFHVLREDEKYRSHYPYLNTLKTSCSAFNLQK